jgi:hypothetical protein
MKQNLKFGCVWASWTGFVPNQKMISIYLVSSAFVMETIVIRFLNWPKQIGPAQNILGLVEGQGIIEIAHHRTYIQ